MSLSEFEYKKAEKIISRFVERIRPPKHIREELDFSYRIENQSIELFGIRPQWNDPTKKIEEKIAKATYVKNSKLWKIYWQRSDLKWHLYEPCKEVKFLEEFVGLVEEDKHACFFG